VESFLFAHITNVHKKDPAKPRRYKMLMALAEILRSNGRTAIGTGDTALLDFLDAGQNPTYSWPAASSKPPPKKSSKICRSRLGKSTALKP
jgi:hypothetical protein